MQRGNHMMKRWPLRDISLSVCCLLIAIAGFESSTTTDVKRFDIVIVNGRVIDPESKLDALRNVGITAGKVESVTAKALQGREVLDAKGLVVAPGFIDLHEHGQVAENYKAQAMD